MEKRYILHMEYIICVVELVRIFSIFYFLLKIYGLYISVEIKLKKVS